MMSFEEFKKVTSLSNDEIFVVDYPFGQTDFYSSVDVVYFMISHFVFANQMLKNVNFSCYSYFWLLNFFKVDNDNNYSDICSILYHIPLNCEKIKVMLQKSINYFQNCNMEKVVTMLSFVDKHDRINNLSTFLNNIIFKG